MTCVDEYILVSGTIKIPKTGTPAAPNNRNNIITKSCAPFINSIKEINNTQLYNAKDIDSVMPMYNQIEYSHSYSKRSEILCQYCINESYLGNNDAIANFPADNNSSASFKLETEIAGRTGYDGTKNVKIRVPLKYLSKFWRTLEMPVINCEINLILTWSARFFKVDASIANEEPAFTITDTKLFVSVVILSTQDNPKLLEQLKSGFKKTINWNKYHPKITEEQQNRYLYFLIDPSFNGINRPLGGTSYTRYYLPLVEIND